VPPLPRARVVPWRTCVDLRYDSHVARIAYFVHGRGRGHASRALSIVPALRRAGHDVATFGGGQAADLLGKWPSHRDVPPVLPGWGAVTAAPVRLVGDVRALGSLHADLVVTDGDPSAALAARLLGVPTVAIGHDLVFSRCRLPAGLPPRLIRAERTSSLITSGADVGVAVHFLPIEPARPRTWVARPSLRPELDGKTESNGHLVAYFRDGNGDDAVRRAARLGARVVCFGQELAGVPNVDARPFDREGFAAALRGAAAVITSAGSNVLAECVLLGKPMLALHRGDEAEQALNAQLAAAAGVAVASSFERLDDAIVDQFLRRVGAGDFATIDLAHLLPDAAEAALRAVDDALVH